MNGNPMTEQVSRLAGNLLANGGAVFLPGIGSLYVERRGARRIDRYRVLPPCRTVAFDAQQRGISLVDAIADVLRKNGVESETAGTQAQSIYDRWADEGREQGSLLIQGVGTLEFRHFTLDSAFDRRLNPHGRRPVQIGKPPRKFDWALWLGLAAAIAFLIGMFCWGGFGAPQGGWIDSLFGRGASSAVRSEAGDASGRALPGVVYLDDSAPADVAFGTDSDFGRQPASAEPEAAEEAYVPRAMTPGRSYVASGVFSSLQNAERAAYRSVQAGTTASCRIYRFGARFLVSPFESDSREACRAFISEHRGLHPDMWTYTAR